jgi:phage I-like protein
MSTPGDVAVGMLEKLWDAHGEEIIAAAATPQVKPPSVTSEEIDQVSAELREFAVKNKAKIEFMLKDSLAGFKAQLSKNVAALSTELEKMVKDNLIDPESENYLLISTELLALRRLINSRDGLSTVEGFLEASEAIKKINAALKVDTVNDENRNINNPLYKDQTLALTLKRLIIPIVLTFICVGLLVPLGVTILIVDLLKEIDIDQKETQLTLLLNGL